jgi:hypothetical protein
LRPPGAVGEYPQNVATVIWLLRKIWRVNFTIVFLANVASLLICAAYIWNTTSHSFLASILLFAPFQGIWLAGDLILQTIKAIKELRAEESNRQ